MGAMKRLLLSLLCLLMFVVLPAVAGGQPLWLNQDHNKLLAVEILKPGFDSSIGTGFSTLTFFFTARLALSEKVSFVGEIPVAHFAPDGSSSSESETAVGNIYLGLEQNGTGGFGEFGVRIPTMPDDKNAAERVGVFSDLDRWEAWLAKAVTIEGFGNFRSLNKTGVGGRGRLGGSVWIPTEGGDAELWIPYTVMGFYRDRGGEVTFGISGRALATEGDLSFDERTFHQLVLAGHLNVGQVQLGVQYRHFLDKSLNEDVNHVFGLTVGLVLK
jgi:hypothetical protein